MKILLLAGGDSNERDVSLASGTAVYDSLKRQDHTVFAIDLQSGKSLIGSDGKFLGAPTAEDSKTTNPTKTDTRALTNALTSPGFRDVEVVFVALHGGAGENGSIQCLLELSGKRYTGSNLVASAMAMNKAITKRLFSSVGIPTPDWELYRVNNNDKADLESRIVERFEFPIIVKPNDSGSTIGLSKVDDKSKLPEAIELTHLESSDILVEEYIAGRELTVSVIDGEALPVVEIIPKGDLYDYEAKYTKGRSDYIAPADIDAEIAEELSIAAVKAYDVLGAAGLTRVDFMMAKDNSLYCLELNTLPGMTELSLAPMAAAAKGISFDKLVDRIIQSAVTR